MTFKLIKLKDKNNHFDNYDVEIAGDITTLEDALELYKYFLLACGFVIDGQLGIEETLGQQLVSALSEANNTPDEE
jgi:hypothetical protein